MQSKINHDCHSSGINEIPPIAVAAQNIPQAGEGIPVKFCDASAMLNLASRIAAQRGMIKAINQKSWVGLINCKAINPGATPKVTMSESESSWAPSSPLTFSALATNPSKKSAIAPKMMQYPAISRF